VTLEGAVVKSARDGLIVTATEAVAPAASRMVTLAEPGLAAPNVRLEPLRDGTTMVLSLLATV